MRIFISGGCKNGKSYYAQHISKAQETENLYYIATMRSSDKEDDERIVRHIKERDGWGFETIEQPDDIADILKKSNINGSFLLDSTTALLANEMFRPDGSINENAADKISDELDVIFDSVENIVVVSDYIYSDAEIYDELTEKYRKSLAQIDRMCAKRCDAVIEIAYTNVIFHKGNDKFDKTFLGL